MRGRGKSGGKDVGVGWIRGVEEALNLLFCFPPAYSERGLNQDSR